MPAAGGSYAAVAALTNIPATLLAYVLYELMLTDSDRGGYTSIRHLPILRRYARSCAGRACGDHQRAQKPPQAARARVGQRRELREEGTRHGG